MRTETKMSMRLLNEQREDAGTGFFTDAFAKGTQVGQYLYIVFLKSRFFLKDIKIIIMVVLLYNIKLEF